MRMTDRDRRDWSLLIFIVPIGILLMMIAGGFAMWATPQWSVQAGMGSSLEIGAGNSQNGPRPLINPQILTPFSWLGTYLTPSGDNTLILPFVVIQPSATPSATVVPVITESPPTQVTVSQTVTVVTTPPANTFTPTATSKPPDDDETPPIPTTCDDSAATNFGGPLPCTYPPTPPTTCDDPLANNNGGPLPCTYPPTPPTPPAGTYVSPSPDANVGNPDESYLYMDNGEYTVIDLGTSPVIVNGPSDINYDLVYYEHPNPIDIYMDQIIIGISQSSNGGSYYVVFYWGDGIPDDNSNVGDEAAAAGAEDDNLVIDSSELYGTPPNQTGILIDVDNATSAPPVGSYQYVVIQVPTTGGDGNAGFDSVDTVDVTPPP